MTSTDLMAVPNGCLIIPLTRGKFSIVDEIDSWVLQWKWHASYQSNWYAVRSINSIRSKIRLHREILIAATGHGRPDMQVDHRNGDSLDNRRCNLRWASVAENGRNRRISCNNASGVTGIYWNKTSRKWHTTLTFERKRVFLGLFRELSEAIEARRKAEIEIHGEFSSTASRS